MALPFRYAARNLFRSKWRFAQLTGGVAVVVLLVMGAQALNEGMRKTLSASGSPHNVLIIGAGSEESMERSEIAARAAGIAETGIRGVATWLGTRAVSPQIVHMAKVGVRDSIAEAFLRGVDSRALLTHPNVVLLEGRFPGPGEIMVGRYAWRRMGVKPDDLAPGKSIRLDGVPLTIVGRFAAPGTVFESEVWMDIHDLRTLAKRETYSAIVVRLAEGDPADVEVFTRQRLDLEISAVPEPVYYQRLAAFYAPIRFMAWATAVLIAAAALMGGLNTVHAAFAGRVRELATLQAIGFSRRAIYLSILQESLLTALAGTFIGALIAVGAISGRVVYLSAGAFELTCDANTLLAGGLAGLFVGILGTVPPVLRCLRPPLPVALRD